MTLVESMHGGDTVQPLGQSKAVSGQGPAASGQGPANEWRRRELGNQAEAVERESVVTTSPPETRVSLILRLRDARDVAAWDEVAAVYSPLVYRLARRKGLQQADADDLVQEVLSAVARSVESWLERPERGRFRAWLLRIARNIAINFLTRPKHQPWASGGARGLEEFGELEVASNSLDQRFDSEYRRQVFRWASQKVREAVSENTWRAFWRTTMDNCTIAQTAEELGMTVGSVYIARSRVMARLREWVSEFEEREA